MHKAGAGGSSKKANPFSRRQALSGIALAVVAAGLKRGGQSFIAPADAAAKKPSPAPARPLDLKYEVLEVGPGKKFPSLTLAGCYMNGVSRWNNGYAGAADIAKMGFRLVVSPGPPGYYVNDSGSHSRRWPELVGWPPYEGNLLGPVIIEGEPGKPAPVLETDGSGDGVLYYQTGLFSTGGCDATFRHLIFRGFRRRDGLGNYAAVRLGQDFADIPMNSHVLFEDCDISKCDNGIMGGVPGQSLTLRRCFIHENGNGTGRAHNIYFGNGDLLTVEDTLSTKAAIGHLLKSRAARTVIRNTRLIGDGGTESACLDVPDGGVLEIDGLVCEKSPGTDAAWIIHYSGENQDQAGMPFHLQSSIRIRNLVMIAPPKMTRYPNAGAMQGFVNQSGLGAEASGKGSFPVPADAQGVKAFGLIDSQVGLPHTMLSARPTLDLKSPIRGQV